MFAIPRSPETQVPEIEFVYAFLPEPGQTATDITQLFRPVQTTLAIEFVGITDNLFFYGTRTEILMRERQILPHNLLQRYAGACMPLRHFSMTGESFTPQQLRPQEAMADILVISIAAYTRRIAKEDTYIVQHCRLIEESRVGVQFRMGLSNRHGLIRHLTTMGQQNSLQLGIGGIVLMNQCFAVHRHRLMQTIEKRLRRHAFLIRELQFENLHKTI